MEELKLKYGNGDVKFSLPKEDILGVIDRNNWSGNKTEEQVIKDAIENTICSAPLKELVHEGEKVCIVIPDITRLWQRCSVYLPFVVKELKKANIKDEDIIFISSTGTHRQQTKEEHKMLLGEELYNKYKVIDHVSTKKDDLVYVGRTSYNTPVMINRIALECDHIILTGGIVYHFLVGYSGGKKAILPGISGFETVMANHSLSFSGNLGDGEDSNVRSGNIYDNPIHNDMLEAASFVRPTFMFNIIIGPDGKIGAAVAGNYIKAHDKGREYVDKIDGVDIKEKADLVIATAGGFPKDINFYQSSKTIINAREACKKDGTIIVLSECSEGLGGDDGVKMMLTDFTNGLDREKELRDNYSISKHTSYIACDTAEKFNLILVSSIDHNLMKNTKVRVVKTLQEALDIVKKEKGEHLKTYVLPHGGNTLPKLV
ncbi:nickel-dependent lactate racemase [Clostridium sp. Marseille-Q2269]|uniref:nickel-dependent lactate racemase n=1 Tax=Clostridium sp. Marseille-Q2269 TaxID=2942205 RepID=UPI002073EFBC|nr:nickel-dependent lactate racemase [Clostridium sp. Marseille-Q2269]